MYICPLPGVLSIAYLIILLLLCCCYLAGHRKKKTLLSIAIRYAQRNKKENATFLKSIQQFIKRNDHDHIVYNEKSTAFFVVYFNVLSINTDD